MTRPPGAGKTVVAAALRERLDLLLLAKDTLKETFGENLDVVGRDASRRLGSAVFELQGHLVRELLTTGVSAIVEGNFHPETAFLHELPPARVLQVHLTAEPDVLYRRDLAREGRHPVHDDAEAAVEMRDAVARGEW